MTGQEDDYSDIINLPRPEQLPFPRMSRSNRAAQFSPFAALNGYDAVIGRAEKIAAEKQKMAQTIKTEADEAL